MGFTSFLKSLSCHKGTSSPNSSPFPSPLPSPPPGSSPARSSYSSSVPLITKESLPIYFRPKSVLSARPSVVPLAITTDTVHGVFCRSKNRLKVALKDALCIRPKPRQLPEPPVRFEALGRCVNGQHKWKQGRCKRCLLRQSEAEDVLSSGFYCDVEDCECRLDTEEEPHTEEDVPQIGPIVLTPSLSSQLALDPTFSPAPSPRRPADQNIPEGILWTIRRVGSSIANISDTSSVVSLRVPQTRLPETSLPRCSGYMDLRLALSDPDGFPEVPTDAEEANDSTAQPHTGEAEQYNTFLDQLSRETAAFLTAQADAALLHRRRSDRSPAPEPSTRPTTRQQQERLFHGTMLNIRHRESRSAAPEPSTRTGSVEQPSQGPSRNASQNQGQRCEAPQNQGHLQEGSEAGSWRTVSEGEGGLEEEQEQEDEGRQDWRLWCE